MAKLDYSVVLIVLVICVLNVHIPFCLCSVGAGCSQLLSDMQAFKVKYFQYLKSISALCCDLNVTLNG